MSEETVQSKKKFDLTSYGVVVGFLSIEVLAFLSFNLGQSFILYGILSLVLAALLLLVTFRQIKKDGISSFAFFIFPVLVFGILTALSKFNSQSVGHIGLAETIFVPIALSCIGLGGYLTSTISKFKVRYMMLVIYGALALFVFINLVITMIYYVPFYTLLYKNSYIVYDGKPSVLPIGSMAYMLFGFTVQEVTIEYFSLFPSILLTAVIPLFFIKFKENKRDFLLFLGFAILAFITLVFTISKITLLTDMVLVLGIAIIVIAGKIKKSRPVINGLFIGFGIAFLIVLMILFLNAQTSWSFLSSLQGALNQGNLISRLFTTNRFSSKIINVFQDLFTSFKLFGWPTGYYAYQYPNGVAQDVSNIWLFDNIVSSGLFGAIFFMVALVIGVRRMFKYFTNSEDEDADKFAIAGYVLGTLVISLLLFDVTPLVNSDAMFPFFTSGPVLIILFLLGYVFNKSNKAVEEVAVLENEENKEIVMEENKDEEISL